MPLGGRPGGRTQMSSSTRLYGLIWALFAVGLWGCGSDAPMSAVQSPAPPASTVVAEVTQRTVPIYGEFAARTRAMQTVELRARVEGFLEQVLFQEGAPVQAPHGRPGARQDVGHTP